jgi:transcriptional regulator with XRE-family HTH domain
LNIAIGARDDNMSAMPRAVDLVQDTQLGALVRSARESRSLTQLQLARMARVSSRTVARLERGLPCSGTVLLAISTVLGVELGEPQPHDSAEGA